MVARSVVYSPHTLGTGSELWRWQRWLQGQQGQRQAAVVPGPACARVWGEPALTVVVPSQHQVKHVPRLRTHIHSGACWQAHSRRQAAVTPHGAGHHTERFAPVSRLHLPSTQKPLLPPTCAASLRSLGTRMWVSATTTSAPRLCEATVRQQLRTRGGSQRRTTVDRSDG